MIIWGSRGLTSTLQSNAFHCPQCDSQREGSLKQVRNFFTLYFIPLIPLNISGRYVECHSCGGNFAEEILSYDPQAELAKTNDQLLRVMVMAALADGRVDEGELAEIKKQYSEIAGLPVTQAKLDDEIRMASESGKTLNSYVTMIADELSPHGKALVVKLAFHTMTGSESMQPGHQSELTQLATTLGIPEDQYRELISQISEPPEE